MNRRKRRAARAGRRSRDAEPGDATLAEAVARHRAGDLAGAAVLYERVLARAPGNADALHLLGMLRHQQGDHAQAADLIARALALTPENALRHHHLAQALAALDRLEEAADHLRRARALRPDVAEIENDLGNVLDGLGRFAEARAAYERAVALDPGLAAAHNNLGTAAAREGRFDDAARHYREALALRPDFADAAANLGNLLADRGQAEEAVDWYRRALAAVPTGAGTAPGEAAGAAADLHANMAAALADLGRSEEAIRHFRAALAAAPDHARALQGLVAALRHAEPREFRPELDRLLARCFAAEGVPHEDLAALAARHLRAKHGWPSSPAAGADVALDAARIDALAADPLLRVFLETCVNVDAAFELCLAAIRRALLFAHAEGGRALDGDRRALAAALVRQCMNNEYVWAPPAADEARRLASLRAALEGRALSPDDEAALLLLALYEPLHGPPWPERLAPVPIEAWSPAFRPLVRDAVHDRLREAELAARVPAIGRIRDATSRAVARQYEENPYPRWLSAPVREPESPAQALRRRLPYADLPDFLAGPVRVLVAGCGTGRHPIVEVAMAYRECEVLAVDLSAASLAYGARMAEKLGVANVSFARADILGLAALDRRFHIVECAGVLHHMADPVAGWRVLADLLVPRGLMMVALYSERGRRAVVRARERIAARGLAPTPEGIRALREEVLAEAGRRPGEEEPGERGAEQGLAALLSWSDFYTMSGCRDLLFHVREHRFTLPRIARILDGLGLEFLGFEFADPRVPRRYRERFPDDPAMTDLGAWDRFEAEFPDTFAAMYQFWCRRRA